MTDEDVRITVHIDYEVPPPPGGPYYPPRCRCPACSTGRRPLGGATIALMLVCYVVAAAAFTCAYLLSP